MDQKSITALLSGTGTADVPSAVRTLSDHAASIPSTEIPDFLWDVFNGVFGVAGQAAGDKEVTALVDLLVQLRKTDVKDPKTGEVRTCEGGKVWSELPTFGWVARDLWNFGMLSCSCPRE